MGSGLGSGLEVAQGSVGVRATGPTVRVGDRLGTGYSAGRGYSRTRRLAYSRTTEATPGLLRLIDVGVGACVGARLLLAGEDVDES